MSVKTVYTTRKVWRYGWRLERRIDMYKGENACDYTIATSTYNVEPSFTFHFPPISSTLPSPPNFFNTNLTPPSAGACNASG